jgi:hypothetical protein
MKCERCGKNIPRQTAYIATKLIEDVPGVTYSRQEYIYCHKCGEKHLDEELGRGIR